MALISAQTLVASRLVVTVLRISAISALSTSLASPTSASSDATLLFRSTGSLVEWM